VESAVGDEAPVVETGRVQDAVHYYLMIAA